MRGSNGLYAKYTTVGKDDFGTRRAAKHFGYDAVKLIDTMDSNTELLNFLEVPVKIYYDGKLILDGEAWEVKDLPQVRALLPK
jgi:hypothetical protein